MHRVWVIMEVMSVKAFEPQAFECVVVDVLRLEMERKNVSRRALSPLRPGSQCLSQPARV